MPARGNEALRLGFIADPNSIHTRRWVSWFARAGHAVLLLDPFGVDIAPGLLPEIGVHRIVARPGLPVVGLPARRRGLAREIRRLGVEILHAHFVRRYGWQAALSGFHPLVVSPWGSDLLRVRARSVRTRLWNRFALRSADLVTVSSERMRHAAVRAGARPSRVELVNHGVDTHRFSPAPHGGGDRAVVLSIRAVKPLYRQETVVDAVAMLAADGLRPELVMTRHGADPAYLRRLEERAHERGIGGQLRILDAVAHDELPTLYRSADVLVSVPESDSFPVTLLEAMACGLPAVVSDLPAVTPVYGAVDPAARELIVPVGDAAATADALRRALRLGEQDHARLVKRLREHVVSTADYDTNMAKMAGLYRDLARR